MIKNISPTLNKIENNNKKQAFKGQGTMLLTGLNGLNDSPALGACAVDLCSMVVPRTIIEFKNRGIQSGTEAMIREGTSCLLHACVGLIGYAAAALISKNFNTTNGVKAQKIFASGDTVRNMAHIWETNSGETKDFFNGFVQNLRGLNGKKWRKVSDVASASIVDNLVTLSEKTAQLASKTGAEKKELSKQVKQLKDVIVSQLTKDTGAQMNYKLKGAVDEAGKVVTKDISLSAAELVDSAVSMANSFKTKTTKEFPSFVEALIKNKKATTILGLGICAAACISIQPLNRFLTKKRTGQDGFVGVDNKKADNSFKFKALKTALGVGFPIGGMKTIGKFSDLLSNIQFMSKIPTINQFKFLYGLTIGSRLLSARDKNELRESFVKDFLGYTNWLILGGMVSKLTARALGGEKLINNPVAKEGKNKLRYAFEWISKSSVKSYDEILMPKFKNTLQDGKVMSLSQMYKKASPAVQQRVKKVAIAQVAGYLYSGIVLGIGIAKLNIFITKKMEAKKKAQKQMNDLTKNQPNTEPVKKLEDTKTTVFKDFN